MTNQPTDAEKEFESKLRSFDYRPHGLEALRDGWFDAAPWVSAVIAEACRLFALREQEHAANLFTFFKLREQEHREEVERLTTQLSLADAACSELAERAANDLDHGGYVHPKWYRAVKRYRKERGK